MSFSLTLRPPLTLAVAETTSRPSPRPFGRRYVVSAAFDPTVTSRADADRLVWTKPHVRLTSFNISNHHPSSYMSHEDTIPLTNWPTKRPASAPVSNCDKRRQRTCRNLSPFATANLPLFAAFSRRLLSHGRLTPWLNQGFLSTHRPRTGQRVERC